MVNKNINFKSTETININYFEAYYNLDSKLEKPDSIGAEDKLIMYLENLIKSKDKELILIVSKEVEQDGSWKKTTN